jgi:histidinol-phosphate phosphatase family protein
VDNLPYNADPSRITLARGAQEALPRLSAAGFRLAVVSNQSGVALGHFPEHALAGVHARLQALLAEIGVSLDGFYYCPHHPDGVLPMYAIRCTCRKPAPGLLFRAARDLGADLTRSWLIGDILDDVEAGNHAGCSTVLLDVGNESEWKLTAERAPRHVAHDLGEAGEIILAASGRGTRHARRSAFTP